MNVSAWRKNRLLIVVAFAALALFASDTASAQKADMKDIDFDVATGDFAPALKKCESLLRSDASGEIGIVYASILARSGEFEKASSHLADLCAKYPESIAVHIAAADYGLSRLDFEGAEKAYRKAFDAVCARPELYSRQSGDFAKLFDRLYNFDRKFNLVSAEVELHVNAALALHSKAPLYVQKAMSYLLDTKNYDRASELAGKIAAASKDRALVSETYITLRQKLVSERIDFEKNSAELTKTYEEYIESLAPSSDKRFVAVTAYFNFLQETGIFSTRVADLKSRADSQKATDAEFRLLLNLLMERSADSDRRKYIALYLGGSPDVKKNYFAARLLRRYGEYFSAMTKLLAIYPSAVTDDEKAELYRELAVNFSNLYFIDCRYLIFKNAAVSALEEECGDFLAGVAVSLNSRRFLRGKLDAFRTATRELISRKSAEFYYRSIIEKFPGYAERDAVLLALGALYKVLDMHDESLAAYTKLIEEKPDSLNRSEALKRIVEHHQAKFSGDPPEIATKSAAAIDWFLKKCGDEALVSARPAIDSMIAYEPPQLLKLTYNQRTFEYVGSLVRRYPKVKWLRERYVGTCAMKAGLTFEQKMVLIDSFLKDSPLDPELLSAKERAISLESSNEKGTRRYEKMLVDFYESVFFLNADYLKKYLELLNRRREMEAQIEKLKTFLVSYPDRPHKLKLLAECYFFLSRFEESEPWFEKYLKLVPTDTRAMKKLFNLKRSFGKNDEALLIVEKMIAAEPSSREHYIAAGDLLALAGKWKEAEERFRKIVAIDPENNDNYLELATIYWDYFKYDDGISVLSQRRKKAGGDFMFGREMANLFELNDSIETAIPEYIAVVCAPDPEEEHDNSRYSEPDGDSEGPEGASDDSSRRGNSGRRRYYHYNYRYERPESEDVIESRARLVTLYRRERIKKKIDSAFEGLIAANNSNFKLPYEYAKILLEYEQKEKASAQVTAALALAKKGYQLITLANLAERAGMIAEARDIFKKAIEIEPKNTSNYNDAIEFMNKYNFNEDYFAILRSRMKNFPDDMYYAEELAKVLMGLKKADASNFREAESLYRAMAERYPSSVTYRNRVSDAIIKTGGIEAAIAYIDGVAADAKKFGMTPDDVTKLRETKANLCLKAGKTDAALAIFAGLISENPYEKSFAGRLAQVAGEYRCYDKVLALLAGLDESLVKPFQKNLTLARFNARCGKMDLALEHYKKALAIEPRNMAVLTEIFAFCRYSKKFDECFKMSKLLLDLAVATRDRSLRLDRAMTVASAYIEAGDTASALLIAREHAFAIFAEESYRLDTGALDRLVELLESYAMHVAAADVLSEKLKFLRGRTYSEVKYRIRETLERLADNLYAARNFEKSMEYVMELIESCQSDSESPTVPDAYLRLAVRLWKALGKYDETIAHHMELARSGNGEEAKRNTLLLLRIFVECGDNRSYMDLARETLDRGEYLSHPIDRSIGILRSLGDGAREELLFLLQARIRHNAGLESSKNFAQYISDIIECGVLAERMECPSLADAMFGTARKLSSSSETLRRIADELLAARRPKALDYYELVLRKYSERTYYLCAPDIAIKLAEAGFGPKGCELAESLLKKYPEDPKIALDAAKAFAAAGARGQSRAILTDYSLKCVRASELSAALAELEKVSDKAEFAIFIGRLSKEKLGQGAGARDYLFLLERQAALAFGTGGATAEAEIARICDEFASKNPTAETLGNFAEFILRGIRENAASLPGARAAYLTYAARFAEALAGDGSKLYPTQSDLVRLCRAFMQNVPSQPGVPPPSFAGDIVPVLKIFKKKLMTLDTWSVTDACKSGAAFADKPAELYSFYREYCDVTSLTACYLARDLLDSGEGATALKFAAFALSLDDENENARFMLARCLAATGAREESVRVAAAVDPSKLTEDNEPYYDGDEYDYCCRYSYPGIRMKLKFAAFASGAGLFAKAAEIARESLVELRRNNLSGRYYLTMSEYRNAVELQYRARTSEVDINDLAALRGELSSMIEAAFAPRDSGEEQPESGNCTLTDDLKSLAGLYAGLRDRFVPATKASAECVTASDYFLEALTEYSLGASAQAGRILSGAHRVYPTYGPVNLMILERADEIADRQLIGSAARKLSYLDPSRSEYAREVTLGQEARRGLAPRENETSDTGAAGNEEGN